MELTKRGKVWYYDGTVDGQRIRRSTGQRDKSVALRVAMHQIQQAELHGDPDPSRALRDAPPARLVVDYRQHLTAQGRSDKHAEMGAARVLLILEPFARMKHVRPHAIQERLHALAAERGWSANTTNGHRLAVSGFFGWLVKGGRWPSNPMQQVGTVKVRDAKQNGRAISDDEAGVRLLLTVKHAETTLVANGVITAVGRRFVVKPA